MVPQRIELYPQDFQSCVQTTYTREPIMIMMEYPSRSNLNCLIVVLRCTGRGCRILLPMLDCRHPDIEKTIIICESSRNRTDSALSNSFTDCPGSPTPAYSQFLYLVVESNHRHLYVKQIRSHYANEAIDF